ncbi:hypothetical protein D9758_006203 [Tetrapyrgos nigripes]|uniref:Zn(2)-C6 fungal-type domain-containing protein n=1 Tax=Tetrapyrgos nigripes TaxID=182062 RepID=A0A8H5LLE1_9AGAR|nr:hypothetical protein D9758_006203 [Tetrapyrgos nigripes]
MACLCKSRLVLPAIVHIPTVPGGEMLDPTAPEPPPAPILQPPPKQKRSSVACRRCRRLRAKCIKEEGDRGLCRGCIDAGVPNECEFLPRGMSAIDRAPRPAARRKRQRRDVSPDGSPSSVTEGPSGLHAGPLAAYGHAVINGYCTCCRQNVPVQPLQSPVTSNAAHSNPPPEELLPPQADLIEACEWFFSTYFQLGFLHKPSFMHTLLTSPSSLSPFLLLSMLSISARFTPSLIQRYGSGPNAAQVFAKRAQKLAGEELLGATTLERAQGFFLCSIWSWGSGYRDRSWIFLGVAARMISILKLSQEETYSLPIDASVEDVINAEVARRTWWVIFMSDNLLSSGCGRPISFDLDKVTIPLPLDEDHFYFGYQGPTTVLPGTRAKPRLPSETNPSPPHIDPQLQQTQRTLNGNGHGEEGSDANGSSNGGERSLYGNLITIADIWARVARSALQRAKAPSLAEGMCNMAPWIPESDYSQLVRELDGWEATLGSRQSWSLSNLLAYQSKNLDMGFRGIFLIMHLAHIVIRRSYLPMMARDVQSGQSSSLRAGNASANTNANKTSIANGKNVNDHGDSPVNASGSGRSGYVFPEGMTPQPPPPRFWETMVHDLFAHALKAIDLVRSWVPTRPFARGCTPMMGFSLFMAGSVLIYLRKWKWLCPSLYPYTESAVHQALEMILDIAQIWPSMGQRWHSGLSQAAAAAFGANNPFSNGSNRDRGVEGLGRAAEEDLSVDDRDGMYRHKNMEESHSEDGDTPPPRSISAGLSNRNQSQSPTLHRDPSSSAVDQGRDRSASVSSSSVAQHTVPSAPPPGPSQAHDAHMLYSLAAAASMDQKRGAAVHDYDHGHGHGQGTHRHGHGAMSGPGASAGSAIPAFIPSGPAGPEQAPIDWNNFQTDMAVLLQDDTQLEHGGDGWAF